MRKIHLVLCYESGANRNEDVWDLNDSVFCLNYSCTKSLLPASRVSVDWADMLNLSAYSFLFIFHFHSSVWVSQVRDCSQCSTARENSLLPTCHHKKTKRGLVWFLLRMFSCCRGPQVILGVHVTWWRWCVHQSINYSYAFMENEMDCNHKRCGHALVKSIKTVTFIFFN